MRQDSRSTSRTQRRKNARARDRRLWTFLGLCALALGWLVFRSSGYARIAAPPAPPDGATAEENPADGKVVDEPAAPKAPTDAELAGMQVNEVGKVMIVMYHDIQDHEAEWARSRENFRKDLERYWNLGYSLIPLNDYLTGNISVPAGKAPLVLTFDDGTRGQFGLIDQEGELVADPKTAVGMLLAFSREHPEFGHAATFYINSGNPFGDSANVKRNLRFLLDNGMEIGNHTRSHENLAYTSAEETAMEIGSLASEVKEACGYEVTSLALPFGGYPESEGNLLEGKWGGHEYSNRGILLVGAEPAASPYSKRFSPLAIPRVRGSQDELDKWLGQFEKYPDQRFISDGMKSTVTTRLGDETDLSPGQVGDRDIRTYRANKSVSDEEPGTR